MSNSLIKIYDKCIWPSTPNGQGQLSGRVSEIESDTRAIIQLDTGSYTWIEHNNAHPLLVTNCAHWEAAGLTPDVSVLDQAASIQEAFREKPITESVSVDVRMEMLFALSRTLENISERYPNIVHPDAAHVLRSMRKGMGDLR